MRLDTIINLLLQWMIIKKAESKDYDNLKEFISKSNSFKGKKKDLYKKINKFKNKKNNK